MNRGQLVERAGRTMGMARSSAENSAEFTLLQDLANEAVLNVLVRTEIHVKRTNLALTAGVTDYDLSQSVLRIWDLFGDDGELLEEVDSADFPGYDGVGAYQFVGYNMFSIAWEPETGDAIEALYTPRPTKMTLDAHDPATVTYGLIPEEFHDALVNYMCWKAGEITRDQSSGMGERFRRLYEGEDGLGRMGTNLGRIQVAVNMRGDSGAMAGRLRRMGERSAADLGASTWR